MADSKKHRFGPWDMGVAVSQHVWMMNWALA
jgi:hypothetical protein